jgi:serine/threonine-protein kinase
MAPEMVLGEPVDERTDVYLLGATLHYLLMRTPRNAGRDVRAASQAAVEGAPVAYPASVPEDLAALANRATARAPGDRPASVRELRQGLADHLQHRSSLALAHSAAERVDELGRLVGGAGLVDEASQRAAERLSVEARFAIEQALAQWRDNPVAQQASGELERLLAARSSRAADLERLARDLDPDALGPHRAIVLGVLALVGLVLTVIGIAMYPAQPSPARLLYQSFVPVGVLAVLSLAMRRQVAATAFNRRLVFAGIAMMGGVALSRALELQAGVATPTILLHDSVLCCITLAISASFLFRWLLWASLLMLAAAVIAALSPAHAHLGFSLASGASFLLVAAFGRRPRGKA